jgi:hypothetical protein
VAENSGPRQSSHGNCVLSAFAVSLSCYPGEPKSGLRPANFLKISVGMAETDRENAEREYTDVSES